MYEYKVSTVIQKPHENTHGKSRYKKMLNCTTLKLYSIKPKNYNGNAKILSKVSTSAQKGVSSSGFCSAHTNHR